MGYELLIRPRPGQPPLSEEALCSWLGRVLREGIGAVALEQSAVAEAAALEAPQQEPLFPPEPSGGAAPETQPAEERHRPAAIDDFPAIGEGPPGPGPAIPALPADGWALANGQGKLHARIYRGEGGSRGADLEVPFGGAEEELRAALDFAVGGARALGAAVFDPQLAREVDRESAEEIVERWRLSQQWAVDVAGTAEDPRSTMALTPAPPLLQRRHKIALAILVALALLYEALGLVVDALR